MTHRDGSPSMDARVRVVRAGEPDPQGRCVLYGMQRARRGRDNPALDRAIGGKHDRPWPERPVFATVRSMTYESTRKTFDSEAYIDRVTAASSR